MKSFALELALALLLVAAPSAFAADITRGFHLKDASADTAHDSCIDGCHEVTSKAALSNVHFDESGYTLHITADVSVVVSDPSHLAYPDLRALDLTVETSALQAAITSGTLDNDNPAQAFGHATLKLASGATVSSRLLCDLYGGPSTQAYFEADRALLCFLDPVAGKDLPLIRFDLVN
jgi:hypothetical protein